MQLKDLLGANIVKERLTTFSILCLCQIDNCSSNDINKLASDRGIMVLLLGIQVGPIVFFLSCLLWCTSVLSFVWFETKLWPPFHSLWSTSSHRFSSQWTNRTGTTWFPHGLKCNLLHDAKTIACLTSVAFCFRWVKLIRELYCVSTQEWLVIFNVSDLPVCHLSRLEPGYVLLGKRAFLRAIKCIEAVSMKIKSEQMQHESYVRVAE